MTHDHGPSERSGYSEEDLYDLHIYHRTDHERNRQKLEGFAGRVVSWTDSKLTRLVVGHSVLDVGAGYGTFTKALSLAGFHATGIDPHEESRRLAKAWNGVDVVDQDIYATTFDDKSFDTIVLREVIEHLDLSRALSEITRLAREAVIIYTTNTDGYVPFMRRIAGHHEYNTNSIDRILALLGEHGLEVDHVEYSDLWSLALSGGFVTRQWLPPIRPLYPLVLRLDDLAAAFLRLIRLDRPLAWRVTIRAILPTRNLGAAED